MRGKRLPFDSLGVRAIVQELQAWIGSRAQKFVQRDALTVQIQLYRNGSAWLLLSADPDFPRFHLSSRIRKGEHDGPTFATELRSRLDGARLSAVVQRGFDRVVDLWFESAQASWVLTAELMGKHSNIILIDGGQRIVAVAKSVGPSKSRRPVLVGRTYLPPPFEARPSLLEAQETDELSEFEGASAFALNWIATHGLSAYQVAARDHGYRPTYVPGRGAYPLPVEGGVPRESFSLALEQAAEELLEQIHVERRRQSLLGQLKRVKLARELAIRDLEAALDVAAKAERLQQMGELILAYAHLISSDADELHTEDYDGKPLSIPLRQDLSPVENANRYFAKAKRARTGEAANRATLHRLQEDSDVLESVMYRLEHASTEDEVSDLEDVCHQRRWLHQQVMAASREERPFEGHAIRETVAPGGWRILYGENATANDYLTQRVAKPNDWWLHVRGSASAHAVIVTGNQPMKVPKEALMAAAEVVVRHSPSKHSSYVPVDYTLKKHVRKPKGAPPGTVVYSHEKTLHVDRK